MGNRFGGGTQIIYVDESTYEKKEEIDFYIINEQENIIIKVVDEKQIELLNCMYGAQLRKHEIDEIIESKEFKYFDSIESYRKWTKAELEALKNNK